LIDEVLAIVTLPICNAGTGDCCAETIGLRNSPHGHVATVTPAGHAEMRRVDWIFFDGCIDSRKDIAQIPAAEIFHVGSGKRLSLAVTTARVRHQHVVTAR
jgi:hypothetical protein